MVPESHGEKKDDLAFFYPPDGFNFQFCWFNLIFLNAPSWSESNFILVLFFYLIWVGPSRSELIRPGLVVRVDPVRLLYLPVNNQSRGLYQVLILPILGWKNDLILKSSEKSCIGQGLHDVGVYENIIFSRI